MHRGYTKTLAFAALFSGLVAALPQDVDAKPTPCFTSTVTTTPICTGRPYFCPEEPDCIIFTESTVPCGNPQCPVTPTVTATAPCRTGCGGCETRTQLISECSVSTTATPTSDSCTTSATASASCFTATTQIPLGVCPVIPNCSAPNCAVTTTVTRPGPNPACPTTTTIRHFGTCNQNCPTACSTVTTTVAAATTTA